MEVVAATPTTTVTTNGSPFHNHDVREWSRLDSITGVLERARLETDQWTSNTANSTHKYNKVVDSRARSGADGNHQQQARRKLEVFQSQVPGGRIQVIKTQTVSSSRWTGLGGGRRINNINNNNNNEDDDDDSRFEDLQLSLNPLDLTSEKSKASVGRSVGRRPPSRSKIRDDILGRDLRTTAATNLHRVSRLCHQIHDDAVRRTFGKYQAPQKQQKQTLSIDERQSGDGVEIVEVESETHSKLSRTKSTSSEDLHDPKNLEDLDEQLQSWRRTSKIRRSLQYPKQKATNSKPPDLPSNTGSVRRIKEDLETGKRLNTALRGNSVDLDALDQILRSISNSSVSSEDKEADPKQQQKRNSFVTVESIRAVRGRLRRTSSPTKDIYRPEEIDDGIVTERQNDMNERVKSYVFGMDGDVQKKIVVTGTGSLESRPKPSSVSVNRNEDWFSRRKSYGFEQMHSQPETMSSKTQSRVESSTDSGICRSTEIVLVPTPTKANTGYVSESEEELKQAFGDDPNVGNVKKYASLFESKKESNYWSKKPEAVTITIPMTEGGSWRENGGEAKRHSIAVDESKYMNKVTDNSFKRTSLAINDQRFDEDEGQGKSKHNKKVEFCKTEVHFAADSGKVNIVETDEKPPPTQNFRRRRRSNLQGDLPVLHFGDTGLEKSMFGDGDEAIYENIGDGGNNKEVVACGNVTVNAINGYQDVGLEEQKENEAPRGILKNKPVKPKPYILGADPQQLHLTTDGGSDSEKTWGVKLKPAQKEEANPIWRSTVTVRNTFYDKEEPQPEFQKLLKQLRPTKEADDESVSEGIRILSPAVDSRRSSWSVADRIKQVEDLKWTENKGYSTKVNFGEGEATVVENRHPTWPRKDEYNKDLKKNLLNKGLVVRIGRNDTNSKHTVCSKTTTNSDTNGTTTTTKITIDLTPSPTNDNDKGGESFRFPRASLQSFKSPSLVRSALGEAVDLVQKRVKVAPQLDALRKLYEDDDDEVHSDSEADEEVHRILMNGSSERRLKDDLLHHNHHEDDDGSSVVSGSWSKMRAFKHINHYQKSITNGSHALLEKADALRLKEETTTESKFRYIDKQIENAISLNQEMEEINSKPEKLSSPYVVSRSKAKCKSSPDHSNCSSLERGTKHVLRQPKQSEMAYFGIKVNKPDLLQFGSNHRKQTKKLVDSPIYENVDQKNRRNKFDSSILEELTKAADQILQAVNGYTDEEQHQHHGKYSSDEERKPPKLDTISETKSWKRSGTQPPKKVVVSKAPKNKRESSNSSIESVPRECRRLASTLERKPFMTKSAEQKQRKKVVSGGGGGSGTDTAKAATKARRLQRASSREALLQSHGSSSEDLANPAEAQVVRKPRMIKKTKSSQFTVSNGLDLKKPKRREDVKTRPSEERLSVGLPEIRHKTAVSTIRSTAEKAASREAKAKLRSEEVQKKRQTVKGGVIGGTTSTSRSADMMRGVLRTTTMTGRDQSHRNPSASNNSSSSKLKKSSRNESTATTKH